MLIGKILKGFHCEMKGLVDEIVTELDHEQARMNISDLANGMAEITAENWADKKQQLLNECSIALENAFQHGATSDSWEEYLDCFFHNEVIGIFSNAWDAGHGNDEEG